MAKRFGALPERAAGDRRLRLVHFRVLIAASARANKVGEPAWAPLARLAEITGMDERDVRRVVRDLEAFGYLKRVARHTAGGKQLANAYTIVLDHDLPVPMEGGEGGSGDPGLRGGSGDPGVQGGEEGSGDPGEGGVRRPRERGGQAPPPSRVIGEDSVEKKLPSSSSAAQELRVRAALPEEFHPELDAYVRSARFPASLLASIWGLLDPEVLPHFSGPIVGQALRQMQAEGRPFKAASLAKWCGNLAADARTPRPAPGEPAAAVSSPLIAAAVAAFAMLPGTDHIRTAFERLTVRYGNKRSLEKAALQVVEAWRDDLKGVTPEELAIAVDRYIAQDAHQWPKVSELRQLVRLLRAERQKGVAQAQLEEPETEGCPEPGCDCGGQGWYLGDDDEPDFYPHHVARARGYQPTERPSMTALAAREMRR